MFVCLFILNHAESDSLMKLSSCLWFRTATGRGVISRVSGSAEINALCIFIPFRSSGAERRMCNDHQQLGGVTLQMFRPRVTRNTRRNTRQNAAVSREVLYYILNPTTQALHIAMVTQTDRQP